MIKFYVTFFTVFLGFLLLADGQTVVVFEDFSTYDGTATTSPAQWTFSNQGLFTNPNYCGVTGPNAYKFSINNSSILTPYFEPSDSISFWLRDSSAVSPSLSKLIIFSTIDSLKWDTLVKITSLPMTGTKYAYKIANSIVQLKIVFFNNSNDYLAFDDFYIKRKSTATADFFAKTVCYGDSTFFQDWSSNLPGGGATVKWLWNFGDGKIDTVQNPVHYYATAGSFSVKLKIVNAKGDMDSVKKFNLVFPRPNENFTTGPLGSCSNRCIQFTDNSVIAGGGVDEDKAAIVTWAWNIAGTLTNIPSPFQCFKTPGTYSVSLTATADNGCVGITAMKTIVIPTGFQTGFTYVNTSNSTFDFTATVSGQSPPITYKWFFGDGDSSSLQSPSHRFLPGFDYTVCLTASSSNAACDLQCDIVKVGAPLGIEEAFVEERFTVFPNPSAGHLFIKSTEAGLLSVYNILGKILVQKYNIDLQTEMDISNLEPGNYFIQYKTNTTSVFKKISILY